MKREYYSDSIVDFLNTGPDQILGILSRNNDFNLEQTQRDAWLAEITILQKVLPRFKGVIYFEYAIPRMGRRIDVLLLIGAVIFVLEFKVGESTFPAYAIDQVWDYALDLKNFHETSHDHYVAPLLIATKAKSETSLIATTAHNDKLLFPVKTNIQTLENVIADILQFADDKEIDTQNWNLGRYQPTPTIIEAAMALYNDHSVSDISRSDASAINLSETSNAISDIIRDSREKGHKSICFVTGVRVPEKLWLVLISQPRISIKIMTFIAYSYLEMAHS